MKNIQTIVEQSLTNIREDFLQRVPHLAGALIILVLTWLIAKLVCRIVHASMDKIVDRDSLVQLMVRLAKTVVWIIGIISAAMLVFPGLTPAKALGAAGLASVAIGLAFKDIFQNFFAGVMLLWKFPFEEGDMIECGDTVGRIKTIELRHTQILDTSGELIILPNSMLITEPVEVLTYQKLRRIELSVGVSYDTDLEHAQKVIEDAVQSLELIDKSKGTEVAAANFGASSVDFEVLIWTSSQPMDRRKAKAEAIATIKKALDDAEIEIPFPYRTLTFKEPLTTNSQSESTQ